MTTSTGPVLVTGGTGFLASRAIVSLLERGHRVRTAVRSPDRADSVRAAVATAVEAGERLELAVADLTRPDGWDDAVAGCEYVIHPASPLGAHHPSDPDELIVPARGGALNVLRAAAAAGVRRVVMTSAANTASPMSYTEEGVYDETTVSVDDPSLPAYRRSKIVAERAAWDFVGEHPGTELTTVLPGAVLGPILSTGNLGSVRARRAGSRVRTRQLPDLAVRIAARSDDALQQILPGLGRRSVHGTRKAERLLGWRPRPAAQTVVDTARSLLAWGGVQTVG